jgi:hypothetical protein
MQYPTSGFEASLARACLIVLHVCATGRGGADMLAVRSLSEAIVMACQLSWCRAVELLRLIHKRCPPVCRYPLAWGIWCTSLRAQPVRMKSERVGSTNEMNLVVRCGVVCAMGYTTATTRHVNAVLTSVARVEVDCWSVYQRVSRDILNDGGSFRVQRAGIRATTHPARHTYQG